VTELPYAKEAVELWHENGLSVEFLEGMSYNHRVQLVEAARRWVSFDTAETREAMKRPEGSVLMAALSHLEDAEAVLRSVSRAAGVVENTANSQGKDSSDV
jgi:hypothetical protein